MVTILLQKIIELLTNFFDGFIEWANTVGDNIASIKDNSDSLPDIKTNTDGLVQLSEINTGNTSAISLRVSEIGNKVTTINTDVGVIKNNVSSISSSSGLTAAHAANIANNTLDMSNRLVTIGSDTTQIRADSGNLAADVAEIKDTLGLYLYNTIVTEDAEGDIASFDTDLKDYLTEAKVTIPADAGGFTGINVVKCGKNLFNLTTADNKWVNSNNNIISGIANTKSNIIPCDSNTTITISSVNPLGSNNFLLIATLDSNGVVTSRTTKSSGTPASLTKTAGSGDKFFLVSFYDYSLTGGGQVEIGSAMSDYEDYISSTDSISFTSITDGAEIDLLNGIIKINTSPVTYDSITPIAIRTYKGVNNIYSDIGTTSVTYRETLKHYLKKQEA